MSIKFHREVTPEKPKPDQRRTVYTIIECDNGKIRLSAGEVALLREMLAAWHEDELFPGTQYTELARLENGTLASEWQWPHDA